MKIEWSAVAIADLARFAEFLHDRFPRLATTIGREIVGKVRTLEGNPLLGHPVGGPARYRQIVFRVLNAAYVIRYRVDGDRVVILRVFHGRETRD